VGGVHIKNDAILLMSLSGGFVLVIYGILCLLTRKTLSTRLRYTLLKAALMFFLFPLPEFKYLFLDALKRLQSFILKVSAIKEVTVERPLINIQYEPTMLPLALLSQIHMIVCRIIMVLSILWQMKNYFKIKAIYRESSVKLDIHDYIDYYEKIKEEVGIQRTIQFAFSGACDTPLTIGLFSPVILFPREMEGNSVDEWDILLRHELNHIKANDLFTRFAARIARDIHWFNPLAHYLYAEICCMGEIHCDARVIKNYGKDMKDRYWHSIISWSENREERCIAVPLRFIGSNPNKILKRRILEMKQPKKEKRLLPILISLVLGIVGVTSVLAYEAPDPIQVLQDLHPDRSYSVRKRTDQDIKLNPNTGDIFVDKNGNVYETNRSERALCSHSYVDVTILEHTLHSDGNCIILYCDAKRCTNCGITKDKEYNGIKTTYVKCPHQIAYYQ